MTDYRPRHELIKTPDEFGICGADLLGEPARLSARDGLSWLSLG